MIYKQKRGGGRRLEFTLELDFDPVFWELIDGDTGQKWSTFKEYLDWKEAKEANRVKNNKRKATLASKQKD